VNFKNITMAGGLVRFLICSAGLPLPQAYRRR
jgi:hypothetical protein